MKPHFPQWTFTREENTVASVAKCKFINSLQKKQKVRSDRKIVSFTPTFTMNNNPQPAQFQL